MGTAHAGAICKLRGMRSLGVIRLRSVGLWRDALNGRERAGKSDAGCGLRVEPRNMRWVAPRVIQVFAAEPSRSTLVLLLTQLPFRK